MVSSVLARFIIVIIGTLYPGYRSYKSLIKADLQGIINSLRYWIVFSIFLACEAVTDVLLSWFPFYYWIKILIVLWMISPAGSTMLYRRFVQPVLREREQEIDQLIEQTKQKGYSTLLDLTNKSFRYASNVFLNTAVLGQAYLGEHLKRSLSTSDINTSPSKGFSNPPATLHEEDEDGNADFNKRLEEDRNYIFKDTKSEVRRPRSQQRVKAQDVPNDPLAEMEMANVIARKQTRSGIKTSSTVYSSNESAHLGTISKRQMIKRTSASAKKPIVKTIVAAEKEEIHSSNETDDEVEQIENST